MGAHLSLQDKVQSASRSTFSRLPNACASNDNESGLKEIRKKSLSKFATLRKKIVRSRRQSRCYDHAKAMREMLSSWLPEDVRVLVQEYEVSSAMKELYLEASLARPSAHSLSYDLSHLYDCKFCTDVDLIFKNNCFPVHRAILTARSPLFKKLLAQHPEYGAQVHIKLKTSGVDVSLFSALLRYLYSDEIVEENMGNVDLLCQLAAEFGVPNVLEHDMKYLLDTGELSDAVLVFSADSDVKDAQSCHHINNPCQCITQSIYVPIRTSKFEFPCHRAIIASRSPFFRNLINRRAKSGEELTERTLKTPSRIILDESVIPRRYARVLLTALYQDIVDMRYVLRGSPSLCSLSEIQAMVSSGRCHMTVVDEAMELYQIGQFLDSQIISQGCENIIIENLTPESLINVLNWSAEPHGSKWVHRQALTFLTEEFIQIAHTPVLYDISKEYLLEVLSSDILQISEQDVLSCVIKWGEHQLTKKIEEREPNILSHTAYSVIKKGVKKRDLNDAELRNLLSEILPLVRIEHILPSASDILNNAVKRGLLEPPISYSNYDDIGSWTGVSKSGVFRKPRFFLPYYEEAKNVLEELLSQDHDSCHKVRAFHLSAIPDTLYMLEDRGATLPSLYSGSPVATVDIIAGSIPVPDKATFVKMLEREQELLQSKAAQQATSLACIDKRGVKKSVALNIQLRIVREFGLPDNAVEIFQNSHYYYSNNGCKCHHIHHSCAQSQHYNQPWQYHLMRCSSRTKTSEAPFSDMERNIFVESTLSDVMPDIAMATTSLSQIHVHEGFAEFDVEKGSERHSMLCLNEQ